MKTKQKLINRLIELKVLNGFNVEYLSSLTDTKNISEFYLKEAIKSLEELNNEDYILAKS
jgi:hypothetical protein